jgi:hypothetical protein
MKKILSLLMCYVFLQAETFALRGGPNQAGGPKVSGTYSGVMISTTSDIGLFVLNASAGGASTGQLVIFSQSGVSSNGYNCALVGLSDTSKGGTGKFIGVFSGAAVIQSTGATQSVSGQMTVVATQSIQQTPRLAGYANSRTLTIPNGTTGTGGTSGTGGTGGSSGTNAVVGPLISYVIDGWLINSANGVPLALQ